MTTTVDEAQLERIAKERRFGPRTLEIARRLFLDNERPKLLAAEYGVIFQRIYAIRKTVLDAAKGEELRDGWASLTLCGPAEAVEAARRAYDRKLASLNATNDSELGRSKVSRSELRD
ncbi:TrfB-related DNA-binding protein [Variovorax sp. J22R24]|uniref:TrfB-related DNA-binding protein n=1 Tax=Variovorax gracilis TaxID=3053502 RepID=UPI002577C44F|nr:TrfB-related DNA-binding protein [Variovorax sp. J22R24]MDM0108037.1 TrfB-related DNA-binding protein [Variovorax sp. J22R24]